MPVANLAMADITGVPYDQWTRTGGASKVDAMNTDDGDTSYLAPTAGGQLQCFNVAWPADIAGVNSIKNAAKMSATDAGLHGIIGVRNGSGHTVYDTGGSMSGSYVLYTSTALSRPGGGSWTPTDCANGVTYYELGFTTGGAGQLRCTYGYLILDYLATGGFMVLLTSFLLPLIGAGLMLSDMPGLNRELARRSHSLTGGRQEYHLRADEYPLAFRALREHRHPHSLSGFVTA